MLIEKEGKERGGGQVEGRGSKVLLRLDGRFLLLLMMTIAPVPVGRVPWRD